MRLEEIARAKALDCDTIEIWFADEARVGQKNKITRRWAKRGTRPSAPRDQRTASTYIFGAVCPKRGKGAALILPACNTEAMNLHLAEIAAAVAPAAHAVLLVDQAGWHMSTRLVVPANITIIALPPKCPELNPVENVWQLAAREDSNLQPDRYERSYHPGRSRKIRYLRWCSTMNVHVWCTNFIGRALAGARLLDLHGGKMEMVTESEIEKAKTPAGGW